MLSGIYPDIVKLYQKGKVPGGSTGAHATGPHVTVLPPDSEYLNVFPSMPQLQVLMRDSGKLYEAALGEAVISPGENNIPIAS